MVFVLDGRIGQYTEGEFFKAADSFNKTNRPEIIVFLHKYSTLTIDIARIQGLIAGRLGDKYYVDYSNLDELKAKARERIERYIKKDESSSTTTQANLAKNNNGSISLNKRFKALLAIMFCIILALLGGLLWSMNKSSDLLIFAGGGSVKNYIEEAKGINVDEYPHSIYANLASGSAWALLTEEASRYQEDGNKRQDSYSSICFSADEIDSTFFNEKTSGIFVNARIVRYKLGTDPLVIYVQNEILAEKGIPKEAVSISVDSLYSLVKYALSKPNDVRLFTTSKTSGTLRLYQKCFTKEKQIDLEKLLDTSQSYLFYKNSTSSYINGLGTAGKDLPYIILGSQYYFPKTINTENVIHYQALYVKKDNENIFKPMNIYFVGRYNEMEPDFCTIKKPIIDFLKAIHADENIEKGIWKDLLDGKLKAEGSSLILKLN